MSNMPNALEQNQCKHKGEEEEDEEEESCLTAILHRQWFLILKRLDWLKYASFSFLVE